jgi:hypothetical protein
MSTTDPNMQKITSRQVAIDKFVEGLRVPQVFIEKKAELLVVLSQVLTFAENLTTKNTTTSTNIYKLYVSWIGVAILVPCLFLMIFKENCADACVWWVHGEEDSKKQETREDTAKVVHALKAISEQGLPMSPLLTAELKNKFHQGSNPMHAPKKGKENEKRKPEPEKEEDVMAMKGGGDEEMDMEMGKSESKKKDEDVKAEEGIGKKSGFSKENDKSNGEKTKSEKKKGEQISGSSTDQTEDHDDFDQTHAFFVDARNRISMVYAENKRTATYNYSLKTWGKVEQLCWALTSICLAVVSGSDIGSTQLEK